MLKICCVLLCLCLVGCVGDDAPHSTMEYASQVPAGGVDLLACPDPGLTLGTIADDLARQYCYGAAGPVVDREACVAQHAVRLGGDADPTLCAPPTTGPWCTRDLFDQRSTALFGGGPFLDEDYALARTGGACPLPATAPERSALRAEACYCGGLGYTCCVFWDPFFEQYRTVCLPEWKCSGNCTGTVLCGAHNPIRRCISIHDPGRCFVYTDDDGSSHQCDDQTSICSGESYDSLPRM